MQKNKIFVLSLQKKLWVAKNWGDWTKTGDLCLPRPEPKTATDDDDDDDVKHNIKNITKVTPS